MAETRMQRPRAWTDEIELEERLCAYCYSVCVTQKWK